MKISFLFSLMLFQLVSSTPLAVNNLPVLCKGVPGSKVECSDLTGGSHKEAIFKCCYESLGFPGELTFTDGKVRAACTALLDRGPKFQACFDALKLPAQDYECHTEKFCFPLDIDQSTLQIYNKQ
ncbi:hypothetical protein BC940DRAFT_301904 [Gongronella butleri]|nr:hypothetical protein BC940DRAFT_301904 [Gongronella butleri]